MTGGFVKIPRSIQLQPWWRDRNTAWLFLWLLLNASHREVVLAGVVWKRGEVVTGRKELAAKTGLSEQNIRSCLANLQNNQQITIQATNRFSKITLCNYNDFNGEKDCDQPAGQPANNQPTNHLSRSNRDKEKNIVRNAPEPSAAGAAGRTRKNGVKIDLEATFARFWDTFADKRGKEPAKRAWSKIKGMTPDLVELIIAGAGRYAAGRAAIVERGGTPKMAQGWLTDRRWEDEAVVPGEPGRGSCATCKNEPLCRWRHTRKDCAEWKPAGGGA